MHTRFKSLKQRLRTLFRRPASPVSPDPPSPKPSAQPDQPDKPAHDTSVRSTPSPASLHTAPSHFTPTPAKRQTPRSTSALTPAGHTRSASNEPRSPASVYATPTPAASNVKVRVSITTTAAPSSPPGPPPYTPAQTPVKPPQKQDFTTPDLKSAVPTPGKTIKRTPPEPARLYTPATPVASARRKQTLRSRVKTPTYKNTASQRLRRQRTGNTVGKDVQATFSIPRRRRTTCEVRTDVRDVFGDMSEGEGLGGVNRWGKEGMGVLQRRVVTEGMERWPSFVPL